MERRGKKFSNKRNVAERRGKLEEKLRDIESESLTGVAKTITSADVSVTLSDDTREQHAEHRFLRTNVFGSSYTRVLFEAGLGTTRHQLAKVAFTSHSAAFSTFLPRVDKGRQRASPVSPRETTRH